MKYFLITLDRKNGKQELLEYPLESTQEALQEYHKIQNRNLCKPWIDSVLLISDDIETLKRTHTSYFPGEYDKILESLQLA